MSNRFCVILNQGNNILTITSRPHGKIHRLRQGQLFIGDGTPYKTYNQGDESWHIIGHIDNLPLLNYLLFNYYPSGADPISEEIISLAVKRHGMSIIALLKGDFCIIHEDAEGNLTLVSEEEDEWCAPAGADTIAGSAAINDEGPCTPAGAYSFYSANGNTNHCDAVPACLSPAGEYLGQRRICVTRWREHNLHFIRSFRSRVDPGSRSVNSDNPPDAKGYFF
ncbi:carbapenam-3-carboxylate synthase domain-containing protein [Sodalis sp. RH23]|uniref:carbapenam-3-carboxylate synthase domain-containing protein n=1 Tax=unclassified Sodalis (in: enterobacteria) TaxID=2636512 RepID=UPI0039B54CFA